MGGVLTVILTTILVPGARLPRVQATLLAEGIQVGAQGVALKKDAPSGSRSVRTRLCASEGPVFVTVIV